MTYGLFVLITCCEPGTDTQRRMLGERVWDKAKRPTGRGPRWQRLSAATQGSGRLRQAPFFKAHCGPASPLASSAKAHTPHTSTSISASTEWPFCPFAVLAERTKSNYSGRQSPWRTVFEKRTHRDGNDHHNPDRANYIHEVKGPKQTSSFSWCLLGCSLFYCINIKC